jgi:hypothetical protein
MAKPSRPSAITSLQETDRKGKKNWLIYGISGVGKTVLAGTAPNALILTVEAAGTESAFNMGSTADELVVDTKAKLDEAFEYFKRGSGCQDYEWVVLDSLSEIEEAFWRNVQGTAMKQKIQDFGTIKTMVLREVEKWNRLPINVLYTAQTMTVDMEDEDGDEITVTLPSMGTKNGVLSQRVCAKTTLNGLLVAKTAKADGGEKKVKEVRRLYLRGNTSFIAKDRHMIAPETGWVRDPTMADLLEAADHKVPLKSKTKKEEKTANG